MEYLRIYEAALALDAFTIRELAASSGANVNTVRSLVTTRNADLFEVVGHQPLIGRGRRPQIFQLRNRRAVQEMVRSKHRDPAIELDPPRRKASPDAGDRGHFAPKPSTRAPKQLTPVTTRELSSRRQARLQHDALAHGDERAWNSLVARHHAALVRYARGFPIGSSEAEDLVQEAYARLYDRVSGVHPDAIYPWLRAVVRNLWLEQLPKRRRELGASVRLAQEIGEVDPVLPELAVLAEEAHQDFERALATLSTHHRDVLKLLADDLDYDEIASRLGIPVGSVGPYRARALEKLRHNEEFRDRVVAEAPDDSASDR